MYSISTRTSTLEKNYNIVEHYIVGAGQGGTAAVLVKQPVWTYGGNNRTRRPFI